MRKLKRLRTLIDDIEDDGIDPDQIFVDPDDIVHVEPEDNGSEEEQMHVILAP